MTTPVNVTSVMAARFRIRRDKASDWERVNPILREGEPGFDQTANSIKIGDGITPWRQLLYVGQTRSPVPSTGHAELDAIIRAHIDSPAPHPVYDDGPSLLLLYQNAKV